MINIFYHPDYIKKRRIFLTRQLKYSKFLSAAIYLSYKLHLPLPKNFIFSGPHQRMSHLTKMFPKKNYSINKLKYENSYIVQFDSWGESILRKILDKDKNSKVIIGPLYNLEYSKKLNIITNKYPNVKKLVASRPAYESALNWPGEKVDTDTLVIWPSGIVKEKNLNVSKNIPKTPLTCLVYFKRREVFDLKALQDFLDFKRINFKVFTYGEYKNSDLDYFADKSDFGVIINGSESQGFAIQNLMSKDLPLLVWDKPTDNYGGVQFNGTSVPYWSDECGKKVLNFQELEINFDSFISNLENFSPSLFVRENLTYEMSRNNLLNLFKEI